MTDTKTQPMDGSQVMEDPDRLAQKLIRRAENRDGVYEIAVGIALLLVAAILTVQLNIEHGSLLRGVAWRGIFSMALVVLGFPAISLALLAAVKWVRARFLIARIGYVEMNPLDAKGRKRLVFVSIFAVIFAAAISFAIALAVISSTRQWVVVGFGVCGGILFPVCSRSWRFAFNGAVIALTGILLGIRNVGILAGCTAIFGAAGAITSITGTVVLLRFLRQTREAGD
jgi:hypothetical protein